MNLQAIILTNCIGFTVLVILLISSSLVRQRRQLSDNLFTSMICVTAVTCIIEMLTFIFDGVQFPGAIPLNMLGNSWLYAANVFVSFTWCIYVDLRLYNDEQRLRKYYLKKSIPAVIALLGVVLNLKFEFAFSIDEQDVYHREPLGYGYYAITFGYLFYSILIRNDYYKKYGKSRFFPIYMFLTPILLGATAQFLVYGISIGWCATSLGLTGIYMSLQNELAYIDPLTKLYNRSYLEHTINEIIRKNAPAGGIMIDLDDFKAINDTFGHSAGDDALIDAAVLIRKSAPEKSIPIRFAGDEFMIMFPNGNEEEILRVLEHLRENIAEFNRRNEKPYHLSFSMGYSLYQPGSTADKFLSEMDEHMYEEKKTKHSRSACPPKANPCI